MLMCPGMKVQSRLVAGSTASSHAKERHESIIFYRRIITQTSVKTLGKSRRCNTSPRKTRQSNTGWWFQTLWKMWIRQLIPFFPIYIYIYICIYGKQKHVPNHQPEHSLTIPQLRCSMTPYGAGIFTYTSYWVISFEFSVDQPSMTTFRIWVRYHPLPRDSENHMGLYGFMRLIWIDMDWYWFIISVGFCPTSNLVGGWATRLIWIRRDDDYSKLNGKIKVMLQSPPTSP